MRKCKKSDKMQTSENRVPFSKFWKFFKWMLFQNKKQELQQGQVFNISFNENQIEFNSEKKDKGYLRTRTPLP